MRDYSFKLSHCSGWECCSEADHWCSDWDQWGGQLQGTDHIQPGRPDCPGHRWRHDLRHLPRGPHHPALQWGGHLDQLQAGPRCLNGAASSIQVRRRRRGTWKIRTSGRSAPIFSSVSLCSSDSLCMLSFVTNILWLTVTEFGMTHIQPFIDRFSQDWYIDYYLVNESFKAFIRILSTLFLYLHTGF